MNKYLDYPKNLISDIGIKCNEYSINNLDNILEELKPREKEVLLMRYEEKLTYEEIGKECGVTGKRISQIISKSISKLKDSSNKLVEEKVIENLRKENEILRKKLEFFRSDIFSNYRNEGIEVLGLSVRAYNGLRKMRINTVGDLLGTNKNDLYKIRNVGRKTIEEIIQRVHDEGLEFIG